MWFDMKRLPAMPLAMLLSVALFASACSLVGDDGEIRVTEVEADLESFEFASVRDWVTFADVVIAYTIISEERLEPDPDYVESGNYSTGSMITVAVDEVLWSAPGIDLPDTLVVSGPQYWIGSDGESQEVPVGFGAVVPGNSYLAALLDFDFEPDGELWGTFSSRSWFELDGDRILGVTQTDERFFGDGQPAENDSEGVSINMVRHEIENADPHVGVATRTDVPNPFLRYEAWLETR